MITIDEIKSILVRVEQGTTTQKDAYRLKGAFAERDRDIINLTAAIEKELERLPRAAVQRD